MPPKGHRAALYLRVSTDGQTTDNQRRVLEEVAQRRGWPIVSVFEDAGISGAKGRDKRPGFDALLKAASRRRFDVLMVWSIDRLGRSAATVATTLEDLTASGIGIYCDKEAMDATTAHGKAMLQMAAVFAELERGMIRERVMAGLERRREDNRKAEAKGDLKSVKALGRPKVGAEMEEAIKAKLASGVGMVKLAKELGVGVSVVQRVRWETADHGVDAAA